MSSPLLFFIAVIIIDLVLKSARDKKKIEKSKQKKQEELQGKSDLNRQKPIEKPESVRGMMATLREEVEKERLKEMQRRQGKIKVKKVPKINVEEENISRKTYEDNEYWEKKRNVEKRRKENELVAKSEVEILGKNMKEDLIKGIIFSEILSEPKSIQNQKRSM